MGENDGYGIESEKHFIDELGNHSQKGILQDRPYKEWLELYIEAHSGSARSIYIAAVKYAREKLLGVSGR